MKYYALINSLENHDIIETAIKEHWINECFPVEGGYIVPIDRLELATKVTRENISSYLFNYELSLIGKSKMDVLDDDQWRFNLTLSSEQYEQLKKHGIGLIRKIFKCKKQAAIDVFDFYYNTFGLRIKN